MADEAYTIYHAHPEYDISIILIVKFVFLFFIEEISMLLNSFPLPWSLHVHAYSNI